QIGCTVCHVPALRLESPIYTEPNPYNPPGNLRPTDVSQPFAVDLTTKAQEPRLHKESDGSVMVPAFTDLKRHDMGATLDNEKVVQTSAPGNFPIPTSQWITRKLWGTANEPPFLHNGRALLLSEAILAHGGEAQASRDAFEALSKSERND